MTIISAFHKNKMVTALYNKTGIFLFTLAFSVLAIANSQTEGVFHESYKVMGLSERLLPKPFPPGIKTSKNASSQSFRPVTPSSLIIQLPGNQPEKDSPTQGASADGGGDQSGDESGDEVKRKPSAAATPNTSGLSQCALPSDHSFTRIPRMQYRQGDSDYYNSNSFLTLPYALSENLLLRLHPEKALQIISTLIAAADPITFIRAVLPGIEAPDELPRSTLIHMLEVYDDALQYFHDDFGHHPGLASAGAIPNVSAMPYIRTGEVSDDGYERYFDFALVDDPIPPEEESPPYRIAETAMYYFVRRVRALIAEENVAEVRMNFRQTSYTPRVDGSPVPVDSIKSEINAVIRVFRHLSERALGRVWGKLYLPISYDETADGTRYLHIEDVPPKLLGLHLEVTLFYLFSVTHKVKTLDELLDNLARFATFFNLVRPFSFCNETTLSNILNMVLILADPELTRGHNGFVFPSKEALQTLSYSEMRALLEGSLTILNERRIDVSGHLMILEDTHTPADQVDAPVSGPELTATPNQLPRKLETLEEFEEFEEFEEPEEPEALEDFEVPEESVELEPLPNEATQSEHGDDNEDYSLMLPQRPGSAAF